MFKYRQSSLWLRKSRCKMSSSCNRQFPNKLPEGKCGSAFWGQTGGAEWAARTPLQCAELTGGMNRNLPTGALAYGIPVKWMWKGE